MKLHLKIVRFNVLMAASMKFRVLDVAPCSQVAVDRRFRGAYCLHHQGNLTTWYYIPEHSKLRLKIFLSFVFQNYT
jgi:hypothetical protein